MTSKKIGNEKQILEASQDSVKHVTQLVSKGLEKSPPWLTPLLVIAGLVGIITCFIAPLLIFIGQPQHGYYIALASFVFFGIALVCFLMAIYIGKRAGSEQAGSTSVSQGSISKTTECPTNAPLLSQVCNLVKSGQHEDILVRRFCCPKDQPTSPSRLDQYSVYHLWADPRGGSIKVSLSDTYKPDHLIIDFENGPSCWAGNVTLRPCGLNPYAKTSEHRYLCIDFQVPTPTRTDDLEKVGVAFRLYDERGTIWYWGRSENDLVTKEINASTDKWPTVALPLDSGEWRLFESDGDHVYSNQKGPVFNRMILAVVIVVGGYLGNREPGPGKGRILVKNIRFEKEPPGAN